ncbi:hypothetical protein [Paenibacillus harenae]|uniref:Uncharacterized protein n=1 Tax=Paenibacillus harenae TaxID=306543 RepID=A0ABT9U2P1_PAEHA|nr:hypothetical protein [Paenibacillus harenae]MDQ0113900.1 hypothetical protein [Paenibacillus harenae]
MARELEKEAVVAVTGVPAEMLEESEGYDGSVVFVSGLTGKRYSVAPVSEVAAWSPEEKQDRQMFGEHAGLCVYELKAWWGSLF